MKIFAKKFMKRFTPNFSLNIRRRKKQLLPCMHRVCPPPRSGPLERNVGSSPWASGLKEACFQHHAWGANSYGRRGGWIHRQPPSEQVAPQKIEHLFKFGSHHRYWIELFAIAQLLLLETTLGDTSRMLHTLLKSELLGTYRCASNAHTCCRAALNY